MTAFGSYTINSIYHTTLSYAGSSWNTVTLPALHLPDQGSTLCWLSLRQVSAISAGNHPGPTPASIELGLAPNYCYYGPGSTVLSSSTSSATCECLGLAGGTAQCTPVSRTVLHARYTSLEQRAEKKALWELTESQGSKKEAWPPETPVTTCNENLC